MHLHELLRQFDSSIDLTGVPDTAIGGLAEDSRKVRPGDVFVARAGLRSDGGTYVAEAQRRGAAAVISAAPVPGTDLPVAVIPQLNASLSRLANLAYDRPSEAVKVLGVTGTNGKTTATYLIRHLLKKIGHRCGMVGTVEIDDGRRVAEATMTTPGAVDVAQLLATMRGAGCAACAIEVSSHALHQGRVNGVSFAAAAFTNLTGDHLDYHKTMDDYAAAKAALFASLAPDAVAVVNANSPWSDAMLKDCRGRVIRFGFGAEADYRAQDLVVGSGGSRFVLHTPDGRAEVQMSLVGRHNVENALTAAALVGEAFGCSVHQLAAGLRDAAGAPGRLQPVRAGQPFAVLVDYAHTDDALENVLTALRPLTRGKLRVLFGCGGDRDRTKRPRMARTAAKLADVVYVTSDNPRTERPGAIIEEIRSGFPAEALRRVVVEPDRRVAIERALTDAAAGDVVLLAGKGHENYQIVGTVKHPFDDAEEATRVLAEQAA